MEIEQGLAVFLDEIKRQFDSGEFNGEAKQNMDGTHFSSIRKILKRLGW